MSSADLWSPHDAVPIFPTTMERISLDRLADVLSGILADAPGVAAVYAYGSRVSGSPLPLSDLDLAVVLTEDAERDDPLLAERLSVEISRALGTRIEIDAHVARDLPLAIRGRVVTEGRLVFEADPSRRVEFETSTRRLYFDFLPFLERDAREGILSGG